MNAPQPPYGQPQFPPPGQGQGRGQGQPGYGPGPGTPPGYGPGPGTPPGYPPGPGGQPGHGHAPGVPQGYGQPPRPAYQPGPAPQAPQQASYQQPPAQAPHQQGAPGGAQGLSLNTVFFPLAWIFFLIKPKIEIDGHQYPNAVWGVNNIPLPPGQHHVHVHAPYLIPTRVGPVDTTINVVPNQVVQLEYKLPVFIFSKGAIGPAPQPYNGVGAAIALFVVPFVLLLILIFLPLLFI